MTFNNIDQYIKESSMENVRKTTIEVLSPGLGVTRSQNFVSRPRAQKNCILLPGWSLTVATQADMDRIEKALRVLPEADEYTFWNTTYDVHGLSFPENSSALIDLFNNQDADFSNTIIIGYSMGGVVARKMIQDGFPCRALVTICSPHQGLADWIPTPDRATMSIAPWSDDLKELNRSGDTEHREKYHLFGITYHDIRGEHNDDAVVHFESAVGSDLANVTMRQEIHLDYRNGLAGIDPHMRGMDPTLTAPFIETCRGLLVAG